ncbi:MAG: fumarylacetoacetase [Alphaproteobacteria bacterium]
MREPNETHDLRRKSWVESANDPAGDFPIQNLPFGVFREGGATRAGVAIGEFVLDAGALAPMLGEHARAAADACRNATLNALMALGHEAASALRLELSQLLSTERADLRGRVERHLIPTHDVELLLPVKIGDFTDFYASVFHATNAGRMFRPDNPLLPNYKYVPVAYHSRASSVRVSGTAFRRPKGQVKPAEGPPLYQPCRHLDYELELGFYAGVPTQLGEPVPVARAEEHIFGFCLLNDWSARDVQAWEYQPLGPFLAKNFMTTVSPWVVTLEALLPYRVRPFARPEGDPAPLPHLTAASDRGLAVTLEAYLVTAEMRRRDLAPFKLSMASTAELYWTVAQMVAHHTSNGCNLETGDLIGSGTVSGADKNAWGSLLELTSRGKEPLTLPSGEKRGFLEDGDEVIFRGYCEKPGYARIGFGECRAAVLPAA